MVRQAYIHRLALGRSAFEPPAWPEGERPQDDTTLDCRPDGPIDSAGGVGSSYVQSFNVRGHPQNSGSRARMRRNIRAHNEVLSTVDVCARVDNEGREIGKAGSRPLLDQDSNVAIIQENETGLWIGFADDLICLVATTFTANLRRRIEVFDFYAGIPLLSIARVELSRLGVFQFFFAGEFANTAFYILETTMDAFIEMGRDALMDRFATPQHSEYEQKRNASLIYCAERGLKLLSFCSLFPLQIYAALQRLNLLPAWPILPNPFRASYFLPLLPPLPLAWDRASLGAYGFSLVTSPLVSFLGMYYFTDRLKTKLNSYARASMPRPDNPDNASYKLGAEEAGSGAAPVLDYPKFQGSLRQEFHKDVLSIVEGLTSLRQRMRNNLRGLFYPKRPVVDFPGVARDDQLVHATHSHPPSAEMQDSGRPSSMTPHGSPPAIVTAGSSTATPSSPLLTPTSSEEPELAVGEQSNVRIRTRTGSTSTLHMDVEFNPPDRGGPVVTSSFAASPRPAIMETMLTPTAHSPHYRVTALSLHASDSLGSHIIGSLASFIRLPFESFYVRCLARNFLAARDPALGQSWMLAHVYPLHNWFGLGLRAGLPATMDYASKMLLCIGIETIITTEVWRLGCKVAYWAGRRWYSWGKL